ncbi:hypothetical protein [Thermococcus sp.]|uniref:hypothetical protein n=1 Tax=Thermococcus sp. TaxID=35749 RepID=UPI0026245ECF|nr:hypothetical protein [Thermococcus sp.]
MVTLDHGRKKKTRYNQENDEEEFILGMLRNIEPILAEDWNKPEDEWWDAVKGKRYKQNLQ